MGWKEFDGVCNAGAVGGTNVDSIASVVVRGAANVEAFLAMDGPSAALFRCFMDKDFGAEWGHGFAVEIMDAIEEGIGR